MDIEIKEGFIYYKKNGKIEVEGMIQYGSIEFVFQDGDVVYINTVTKKKK